MVSLPRLAWPIVIAFLMALCLVPGPSEAVDGSKAITVADAINLGRIFTQKDATAPSDAEFPVSISPNGKLFVVRVLRGDVKRDGDWLELYVGKTESLSEAHRVRLATRLFTRALEHPPIYGHNLEEIFNPLYWLDEYHVAMRWSDKRDFAQVVSIDVRSGRTRYLTKAANGAANFSAGPDSVVLYTSNLDPEGKGTEEVDGFGGRLVTASDAYALAEGKVAGKSLLTRIHDLGFFLVRGSSGNAVKVDQLRGQSGLWRSIVPKWSHDGHRIILNAWATVPSQSWRGYVNLPGPEYALMKRIVPDALRDPESWNGRLLSRLYILDVRSGRATPLWNAPSFINFGGGDQVAWSPNDAEVAVAPALSPPEPDGQAGHLCAAVVNVVSGIHACLPLSAKNWNSFRDLKWLTRDRIEMTVDDRVETFERSRDGWGILAREGDRRVETKSPAVRFEIRESQNEPPKLYGVSDIDNKAELILDPNPGLLARYQLGPVRGISWTDRRGRTHSGNLYMPPDYDPGKRYPLVIQLGSPLTDRGHFDLYGAGWGASLGPSQSVYAAQPLTARGVLVLAFPRLSASPEDIGVNEEQSNADSLEATIECLASQGIIDPTRVGLAGESRNGWLIKQILSHSEFPYAAAIVADAFDSGYVVTTLSPQTSTDGENGAPPFGSGLSHWLENSAGFNADRIRTPLRLEDESEAGAAMLESWELFSRMRELKLPVEYYVVPDVKHGSHTLENPNQLLAVKLGAVEWFDFWLNGAVPDDRRFAVEITNWNKLRELQAAAVKRPRPPLLKWNATAVK